MPRLKINADKPHLWKADIAASVDQFNQWFMRFAPEAFRSTRIKTTKQVKAALLATNDLRSLNCDALRARPGALPTLRMCTAPPLAVDRLIGLASANKSLIGSMEEGKLSSRMKPELLAQHLTSVCNVLVRLLDRDIFPWLDADSTPSDHERDRAVLRVANRLDHSGSREEIQEARRAYLLSAVAAFLESLGFQETKPSSKHRSMIAPGCYVLDVYIPLAMGREWCTHIDCFMRPEGDRREQLTVLLDVKPQGESRRRQTLARIVRKYRLIRMSYGESARYLVVVDSGWDSASLGVLAAEGVDWAWGHRVFELARLL